MTTRQATPPRWTMTGGRAVTASPFLIAGIVNITPDSFSDGGFFLERQAALGRVRQVVDEGAHMVDLGAESTRPGAPAIDGEEEWSCLAPVLEETLLLRAARMREAQSAEPPFAVSVDTYRASTAARALEAGSPPVDVINDISGGLFDPDMGEVLASYKPGYILGHCPVPPCVMQDAPRYDDVVGELLDWFTRRMAALVKAGLPEDRIALDPCIGFGKNLTHNLAIFQAVGRLAALGRPLYFGISRKRFLGEITGLDIHDRTAPSLAASFYLARQGVYAHRVHDVAQTMAALRMASVLP